MSHLKKCDVFVQILHMNVTNMKYEKSGSTELSSCLSNIAVFILCRLNCTCSFPVWCLGQDVEFVSTGPDHCPFFIYFTQTGTFPRTQVHKIEVIVNK